MNLLLLVNPVQYKTLIIFPIVLMSIQTLQPIPVLAFQGAEIIPISIEILRPPYAEGVVIGTVASTVLFYNSNPQASPFDKIQTLIDKLSEDKLSENKLASNNEINSITSPDPEIRSLLEMPPSGEPDLGGEMNHPPLERVNPPEIR